MKCHPWRKGSRESSRGRHVSSLWADIPHACALRLLGARIERVVSRSEPGFPLCFLAGGAGVALSPQEACLATTGGLNPVFFA